MRSFIRFRFSFCRDRYPAAGRRQKVHPVLTGCCALLAVLIGGGNYSTALTTSFIASVLCAAWLFFKKPGRFRLAVILLILLVSFAISVLAPGNAVRAAREASISCAGHSSSLSNAVIWVMSWVNLPQIVLFVIAGVFSTACRIAASFRSGIRCWQVF